MNLKQLICLWAGIAVFVLMGLFPPWYWATRGQTPAMYSYTYAFLWGSLEPVYHLDIERLCVQWPVVAVITGGLMLIFHDGKATKPPIERESRKMDSESSIQGTDADGP